MDSKTFVAALRKHALTLLLIFIPILAAVFVWSSVFSFVPVPWPDDSAFYFVARDFFHWPPRWVMLPQAPFEPTYAEFNFNTMPLYPILIGLGLRLGIDGSHLLKFWPLAAWALTGILLGRVLFKQKLPKLQTLLLILVFSLDPILRWGSVIVRPESLIGLFGLTLVLLLTYGAPKRFAAKELWEPISALLALGAYAHFNAVHLVYPVLLSLFYFPKKLVRVATLTLLYLFPWLICVAVFPNLFFKQMTLQWTRLAVPNDWLSSGTKIWTGLFDSMGNPEPWPQVLYLSNFILWGLIFCAAGLVGEFFYRAILGRKLGIQKIPTSVLRLLPSAVWVLSSVWLWHTKPEVWFKYYIHVSLLSFFGILGWEIWNHPHAKNRLLKKVWTGSAYFLLGIFLFTNWIQWHSLNQSESWRWTTYESQIDCIDQRLSDYERELGNPKPFEVWSPTFPDITIELSRRHPDWYLTRTNDFWVRHHLGIEHGKKVHAVVVNETINLDERNISGPWRNHPEVRSAWLAWKEYFLYKLFMTPDWKPNRYICQRGRWQAFIFTDQPKPEGRNLPLLED